jgi:hypothetical protein
MLRFREYRIDLVGHPHRFGELRVVSILLNHPNEHDKGDNRHDCRKEKGHQKRLPVSY